MKVMYRHYRICLWAGLMYRNRRGFHRPAPCGGMTHCAILDDDGRVVSVGMSLCSLKDNFCYATGREVARDRAEKGESFVWPESKAAELVPYHSREDGAVEEWIERWAVEAHDG